MKKLAILVIMLMIGCSAQLYAQGKSTISYSIGFGTGDINDYISKASFRGISYEYTRFINPNVGIGFSVGWNVFYSELERDTYVTDNASITGKQYRYSNHVPVLFRSAYYLKSDSNFIPFAGAGIGTIYSRRNTDMGLYSIEQEAWNFALVPEIGFQYRLQMDNAINVSLKYYNGFKAGNELDAAQSYLALNFGFTL